MRRQPHPLYNAELAWVTLGLIVYMVCAILAAPLVWLYKRTTKNL